MNLIKWAEKSSQQMKWHHFGALKIGVAAATLLLAKLFPVLLALDWYWYAIIFGVSYITMLHGFLAKSES